MRLQAAAMADDYAAEGWLYVSFKPARSWIATCKVGGYASSTAAQSEGLQKKKEYETLFRHPQLDSKPFQVPGSGGTGSPTGSSARACLALG